jgi:hypothetical protein
MVEGKKPKSVAFMKDAELIELAKRSNINVRHMAGGTWNKRKIAKKGRGSQTPGNKKRKDTCQLSPVGGLPRKYWARSRSYKDRSYGDYCRTMDKYNGQSRAQ